MLLDHNMEIKSQRERKEGILCWVLGTTSHLSKAGFALGFEQGCSFGVSFSMCYLIFFFFFFGEIFCYLNRKTKFLLVKRHFNVADEVSSSVFCISLV